MKTMEGIGIMKSAAENVSKQIAEETSELGRELRTVTVNKLCAGAMC